jgi:hypothetical protein
MTILNLAAHDEMLGAFSTINKQSWPNFLLEGSEPIPYCWVTIMSEFAHCQLILVDDTGTAIAVANGVPIAWNGTIAGLPAGWDDAVLQSITNLDAGITPNTLTALSITISPAHKGSGLSYTMLNAMKEAAVQAGYEYLIVPVRPSLKSIYPITPIEDYMTWKDANGQLFDPWVRAHLKSGGKILQICHQSMTVKAGIAEWEQWTNMKFPETGKFIVPKALNPVEINRETNSGLYIEPNVWVQHDLKVQ